MSSEDKIRKRLKKRRDRLRAKIEDLLKRKDEIIAEQVDRFRKHLEAVYDARIRYLVWRMSTIEDKEKTGLVAYAQKVYHFRYFYYLRLGHQKDKAREEAMNDVINALYKYSGVLGLPVDVDKILSMAGIT